MAASTTTTRASKSRLERIHQKFRTNVENGKFYEASHMIKTLFHRYKSQKKYEDSENLLFYSIVTFLQHEQHESAFELSKLLIELYKELDYDVDKGVEKIVDIIKESSTETKSRSDFIQQALSWTTSKHKHGDERVHEAAAAKYWEEKDYQNARQHIIHTSDGKMCATFLIEYHVVLGFPGEIDLFVTQAVLQFLCLQKVMMANTTFTGYTTNHPGICRKSHPFKQPLLNFIAFLLLSLEKGSVEQFSLLCEQYKLSIRRDPIYSTYLDKIGQLFFGLPPPQRSSMDGMIGNLMDSFFGNMSNANEASTSVADGDVVMEAIHEDCD